MRTGMPVIHALAAAAAAAPFADPRAASPYAPVTAAATYQPALCKTLLREGYGAHCCGTHLPPLVVGLARTSANTAPGPKQHEEIVSISAQPKP